MRTMILYLLVLGWALVGVLAAQQVACTINPAEIYCE